MSYHDNFDAEAFQSCRRAALARLLEDADFYDLTLVASDGQLRLPASRLLLASCSPILEEKLRTAAAGSELQLPELSPAAAQALRRLSVGDASCRSLESEAPKEAQVLWELLQGRSFRMKAETRPSHLVLLLFAAAVLGITLAAYYPVATFNMEAGGFFMDDAMIRRNQVVVDNAMDWRRLMRTDYWGLEMFDASTWTHKSFRPLTVLTFRWNYQLHGFNNAGFHVTNAVLHGICSLQLGFFAWRALQLSWSWSLILAALFALHPIHTESICYVVGRADIICAQVLLLALEVYVPCVAASGLMESASRLALALLLVLHAGLCKETGFTFFGVLVVWEVLAMTRSRGRSRGFLGAVLRILVVLSVGSLACVFRVWYTAGTKIARMDPYSNPIAASDDAWARLLSYAFVHGIYGKLLVWPVFLCYDYSMDAVPLILSLEDLRLLLPCTAYLGFCIVASVSTRLLRGQRRVAADSSTIGLAIFVLSFLPMTNILFPIGTLVAERLLYIPSMGFLMCVVSGSKLALDGSGKSRPMRQSIVASGLLLLLLFWWNLCRLRVAEWRSSDMITLVDGLKQLRSSRTQFNLANLYLQGGKLDEALAAYRRAVAADPQERDAQPLYHAGQILMYQGHYQEAEAYLHKAVTGYFSPLTLHEEEVWHDYGLALWHVGRTEEAVQNFQNALITNPAFPKGYNNLACALAISGLLKQPPDMSLVQQGVEAMEQAVTLLPARDLYWRNAAALLHIAGHTQTALSAWENFRRLSPEAAAAQEATGALPQDCSWEFYFR